MIKIAHCIIAVDCDPVQHEKLKTAINNRKYALNKFRAGYNIPHISEIRLYNFRVKKEIVPFLLRDLSARNMMDPELLLHTAKQLEPEKMEKFKKPPLKFRIGAWVLKKVLRTIGIHEPPEHADNPKMPFVDGWSYAYCFGILKDKETEWGEWL